MLGAPPSGAHALHSCCFAAAGVWRQAGATLRKKVRRAGVLVTKCDSGHVWMKAWIHAFKHPYHMTTGSNGKFVIDELPAGSYVLKVWHEAAGVVSRKFTVTPSQTLRLDFELQAK